MSIKDLKIGDVIQFNYPGFTLVDKSNYQGKITKIYTDSVVVDNNIHVNEKYIIKKMENKNNTISINDLKIGDRVKYNFQDKEYEDFIWDIDNDYVYFEGMYQSDRSVKKANIICRLDGILDPMTSNKVPISYIEKPIEHKINKPYIKISDLKIGDRVRHYYPEWISIGEGEITRIDGLYITINQTVIINKDLIICKLEDNYIKGFPAQYKKIPIKKEEFSIHSVCCPTCHKGYSIKVNDLQKDQSTPKSIHIKDLKPGDDIQFIISNEPKYKSGKIQSFQRPDVWLNDGVLDFKIQEYQITHKIIKNKILEYIPIIAPKSYKFNYTKTGYDFWIPAEIMKELKIYKEYTIEIKEKE